MISPGLRIGRYEVGKRLGRGGFGVVHLARDVDLDRDVAIKVLKPEFVAKPQIVQRFLQEARAAARIGHAGIVTVFECGQIQNTNSRADGTAYIAMELLVGESLADRLLNGGRMASAQAIAITRQLAAALGAAHAAGIVHRDLKPDNVFLVPDPAVHGGERVKILDFGVAKLMDPDEDGINTHSQLMLGTPKYMSPEQARSASKADHRSDLYTLGCLLFEMVTGRAPFSGGDAGDQLIAHQQAPPPSARSIVDSVPRAVDELIARLLAKSPDDRPQSARDVTDALTDLADEPDTMVRAPIEPTPEPRLSTEITAVAPPVREHPRSIDVRIVLAIGVGVALLSMLVVFIAMRDGGGNKPMPVPVIVAIDAAVPIDAIVVSIDATDDDDDDDDARRVRLTCASAADSRMWADLIRCSEELKPIDPARADELYANAHAEMRAEAELRALDVALVERSMTKARTALDAISTESVYRKDAQSRYRAAAGRVRDEVVAALRKAPNCKAHDRLVAQLAATLPADLLYEVTEAAPCEAKPAASATCDTDVLLGKAQDAYATGNAAGAIGFYEAAYKCRPSVDILRRLLLSACTARNLPKARRYYKNLTPAMQPWAVGACANKGVFEKDLEAP